MKIIITLIILLVGLPFGIYKYFLSSGPRDLGVTYTESDRQNAYTTNGVESLTITASPDNPDGVKYEGKKDINVSFSSAEITALNNSVKWVNYPVSNIQIKINPDGTGEASGVVDVKKILSWVSFTHSVKEIESKIQEYNIGFTPAFYLKGKVNVLDNKVTLSPSTVEVGRITIPQNLVSENIAALENFIEDRIDSVPNFNVRSLNLDGGKVNLNATVPEKEYTVQ